MRENIPVDDDPQRLHHELQLELMQMLEEAIERAENQSATKHDFYVIRSFCGLPKEK